MPSAVVSTSAALGRLFVFDEDGREAYARSQPSGAELFAEARFGERPPQRARPASLRGVLFEDALASVTPASRLEVRPAPEMVSSGIAALDALAGGLPRGCLTEICGPASSGHTTLLLAALAAFTRRGEFCAVVDASDALDPQSVGDAGVELERLLWVRCGENSPRRHPSAALRAGSATEKKNLKTNQILKLDEAGSRQAEHGLEQLLRATDLLLESGGFGLVALDLSDLPLQAARRIPLTTWFRFRRAVEHTSTVLLAVEQKSIAGSCSSLLIELEAAGNRISEPPLYSQFPAPAHTQLLTGLEITAELMRSRLERKPVRPAAITFASTTAWAG
jgi:recA bacterial DNA recombination protein